MNIKILTIISLGLIIGCAKSASPKKDSKWITPSNSTCTKSGGKIDENGCKINWFGGNIICRESGGKLPTLDDLKNEITRCNGVVTQSSRGIGEMIKNMSNSSYQSCYKNNGFSSTSHWTSSTVSRFHPLAIYVSFKGGLKGAFPKGSAIHIKCVKNK